MGAKESILKDVEVGEQLPEECGLYRMWTSVFPGRYQDRTKVTVFVREFADTDSSETRKFFQNGLQALKQLRHPSILSYRASSVTNSEACLVTEKAQPLELIIENLDPVEILSGLVNVLDALVFLHDKAGLCHNNVCPSSVFVTADGVWKLGSFECALKMENSRHWVLSDFVKAIKEPVFVPPEDQQMMKKDVPPHARDSYGFGKLIEYLVPYVESVFDTARRECLEDLIETLTEDDASLRQELGGISKDGPALSNDLSLLSSFLHNIPLKSNEEIETFFKNSVERLRNLPPIVVGRRLVKNLLSRYVLLERSAVEHLLPSLLQPKDEEYERSEGLLPPELYKKHVIPEVSRIFCVHETAVRLALLSHFDCYVTALGRQTLEKVVLPELLLGMKDTNEEIVSSSLRCLADVVPILGAQVVTGLIHKKYFAEGKPRKLVFEPTDLKNVKVALKSDLKSREQMEENNRRKEKEKRAEDRRKQMEQKRRQQKEKLALSRKTTEKPWKQLPEESKGEPEERSETEEIDESLVETAERDPEIPKYQESLETKQNYDNAEADSDWQEWEEEVAPPPQEITSELSLARSSGGRSGSSLSDGAKTGLRDAEAGKNNSRKSNKSSVDSPLGSEFDVMALEVDESVVKGEGAEPDYFADMQPEIGGKTDCSKEREWSWAEKGKKVVNTAEKPKNMFEMAAEDNVETSWDSDGWGED